MYEHDTVEECVECGDHLTDCDEDGYCNLCGYGPEEYDFDL